MAQFCVFTRLRQFSPFGFLKENIMKQFVILLAAVAMTGFMSSESQAQYYRGGSSFGISIGSGYGGGFNRGFGGFSGGYGARPVYGYGGGFNRSGINYSRSGYRGGYSGGYGRSYGGGRGCRY